MLKTGAIVTCTLQEALMGPKSNYTTVGEKSAELESEEEDPAAKYEEEDSMSSYSRANSLLLPLILDGNEGEMMSLILQR
jgi:hypothetical protein